MDEKFQQIMVEKIILILASKGELTPKDEYVLSQFSGLLNTDNLKSGIYINNSYIIDSKLCK